MPAGDEESGAYGVQTAHVVHVRRQLEQPRMPPARHLRAAAGERAVDDHGPRRGRGHGVRVQPLQLQPGVRERAAPEGADHLGAQLVVLRLGRIRPLDEVRAADAEIPLRVAPLIVGDPQRLVSSQRVVDESVDRPVPGRVPHGQQLGPASAVRQRHVDERRIEGVAPLDRQRERALAFDQGAADVAFEGLLPLGPLLGDERTARAQGAVTQPGAEATAQRASPGLGDDVDPLGFRRVVLRRKGVAHDVDRLDP